jgi:hypothetical protein
MTLYDQVKRGYLALKGPTSSESARRAGLLKHVIETEASTWSTWVEMPLSTRLWLWRHGFHSPEYLLYDFDDYGPEAYVSGVQRRFADRINEPWSVLVDNKLAFHWLLSPFADYRTELYGVVDDDRFHPVGDAEPDISPRAVAGTGEALTVPESLFDAESVPGGQGVAETVREAGRVVLKSASGSGGKSVVTCRYEGGDYYWNGDPVGRSELDSTVADLSSTLVYSHIDQTAFADDLCPDAVSTLRILTCYDDAGGEPFIAIAVYRVATADSAPVDNWSAGSLSAEVDLADGTLGPGVKFPFSGDVAWHADHPDTGTRVEGATVPNWDDIRSTILEMAEHYSYLPYLGWDVVPTDDGFTVIEANSCTDVNLLQVHRPLLVDDRTRRFYERHGIA